MTASLAISSIWLPNILFLQLQGRCSCGVVAVAVSEVDQLMCAFPNKHVNWQCSKGPNIHPYTKQCLGLGVVLTGPLLAG